MFTLPSKNSVKNTMKGHIKIVGTNDGCDRLKDKSGDGELIYQYHKNYVLNFQNEDFFIELQDFIILGDIMEYSAWIGDKNHQYGRIAFQFKPNN